jgi:uncharacterized LabA/DUF88 family protein
MSTYVFVDLNNFLSGYQKLMKDVFGAGEYAPHLEMVGRSFNADRVYVYEGAPREPREGETEEAFRERRDAVERRLRAIARLDDVVVRTGSQSRSSKVERRMEQKEVDVLLAVELVTHAFRGTIKHAILLSADLDYRPAVDTAVETGTRVTVACFRHQLSQDLGLVEAADRWISHSVRWCVDVCEPQLRPGTLMNTGDMFSYHRKAEIETGPYAGLKVYKTRDGNIVVGAWPKRPSWTATREVAEKIIALEYEGLCLPHDW